MLSARPSRSKASASSRFIFSIGGLFLGIAVGIGLAWLAELTDARVQREKDLEYLVAVRVLVGIPHLSMPGEQSRMAMIRWMERGAVAALLILILAGTVYIFLGG